MNISEKQLVGKPKTIGKYRGLPVMEASTLGGYALVFAVKKSGETEMLGTGSHLAIARHVAQKHNPEIQLTELSKSESLPMWLAEKLAVEEGAYELLAEMKKSEAELAGK